MVFITLQSVQKEHQIRMKVRSEWKSDQNESQIRMKWYNDGKLPVLVCRLLGSGMNTAESTAFGITETMRGSNEALSTVFSLLQQIGNIPNYMSKTKKTRESSRERDLERALERALESSREREL